MCARTLTEVTVAEEEAREAVEKKLAAIGWGLFFIWLGVGFFFQIGTGIILVGIGVVTLGMQGVRRYMSLDLERFWLVCGAIFFLAGLWELFSLDPPFVALLLVLIGVAIMFRAFRSRRRQGREQEKQIPLPY